MESANGICVLSVAKALSKDNSVYILNSSKKTNDEENLEYIYLPNDVFSRLSQNSNSFVKKIAMIGNRVWIVLMYSKWPFSRPLYYKRLKKMCASVVAEKGIDVIIPVYGPIETVLAAMEAKEEYNISLVPYFLDSLLGGPTPRFMSKEKKERKAIKFEKKIASKANKIFMMLGAKKLYSECEYRDKIDFLDLPLLIKHDENNSRICPDKETAKSIVYVGNISKSIRNPEFILSVLSKLKTKYECYFIGNSDCELIFEKYIRKDNRIHKLSAVSYSEAQKYLEKADYLLNIGNSLEYMVPSKIFEYFSYSKPIITTKKIDNDPAIEYMRKYNKAVVLDEQDKEERSVELLDHFLNFCEGDIKIDDSIYQTLYLNTPDAFVKNLERVIRNENKNRTKDVV
ncbi:MAG: glycosyltransferase [Lachnospiraceae bacterium]|nr:glycosyltransferase [Lachnospiraceae bacterium]